MRIEIPGEVYLNGLDFEFRKV